MSNGGHIEGYKACGRCKEVKPFDQFYMRKDRDIQNRTVKNATRPTTKRQRKFKKQCIEYKGGSVLGVAIKDTMVR